MSRLVDGGQQQTSVDAKSATAATAARYANLPRFRQQMADTPDARDTVVVKPDDMLITAYNRMKLHDVSQLPVLDGEKIVGIIDESDLLPHVYGDEKRFVEPVSAAMITELQTLSVKAPIEDLLPVFDHGRVAIVMDSTKFLGLITRIDLLNYLRHRVA